MDSSASHGQSAISLDAEMEPLYMPLDEKILEFRLLEIIDTPDGSISCRLSKATFDRSTAKPEYGALSYVWGDPSNTEVIILNDRRVSVTKNLATALRYVKKHWKLEFPNKSPSLFRIWVDSLCINQQDLAERAHQVARMQYMYTLADIVLAWLGDEDELISLAFETIERLAEILIDPSNTEEDVVTLAWLKKEPSLCQDDNLDIPPPDLARNRRWSSLQQLFYLPDWSRVWIFQEVVLARRLIYVCPSRRLGAQIFKVVAELMGKMRRVVVHNSMTRPDFLSQACWLAVSCPIINWGNINEIEQIKHQVGVPDTKLDTPAKIVSAIQLSTRGGDYSATDPKDHIYGLIGLTHMDIIPDYRKEKSFIDVYCDYVAHCLEVYPVEAFLELDELFFLSSAGAGISVEGLELPSWVPNYPAEAKGNSSAIPGLDGCFADAAVFDSNIRGQKAVVDGRSLYLIGLEVQRVSNCLTTGHSGRQEMLNFFIGFTSSHETYITGIPPLQALFRVFKRNTKAGRQYTTLKEVIGFLQYLFLGPKEFGPDFLSDISIQLGRKPEKSFDDWLLSSFFPEIDFSTGRPRDTPGIALLLALANIGDRTYLGEVEQNIVTMQSLQKCAASYFETEDGYLGLAPHGTLPGDIVGILKGYRAPVILRRRGDHYVFVGTCFVLGLMYGEARALAEEGRAKIDVFELR
jgi:hypothetical protein